MLNGPVNKPMRALTLRPHQREFVDRLAQACPPSRFLLSCPPGGGKMAALSAAVDAIQARRRGFRCLVIASPALARFWLQQLRTLPPLYPTLMTPQEYRAIQAGTGIRDNVWERVQCAVVSVDFLKAADRMDEVLSIKWDLVILDEAHRSTTSTLRGDLAKRIWNSDQVAIAVAATSIPDAPAWMAADAKTTKIHWRLGDIFEHRPLPQRHTHNVFYIPSQSARQVAKQLNDLVNQMPKDPASQLTALLLRRRMLSSRYALEQTLRRLLTVDSFGETELNDWTPDDIDEDSDASSGANSVEIDRIGAERILAALENEPSDSKWECCFELLSGLSIGKTCAGILFTDFAETAEYVEYLAKSRGLNTVLFTGASTASEREQALQTASRSPCLLIASNAIEGAAIRFTNQVIHYDLPWNPRLFEQRIGRVERVGAQFSTFDHYLILEKDGETAVLERLMSKVREIEAVWQ